ncbi:DUF1651 domain-containing protein [Synechococcus sp. UW140]|uniref:DUF1651 domain-containing protein n=1 Tax=Synechococcus sp. UW140 TaxID=368503 RepID=UPI000E0EED61|nr:DUF1651 domain-containing protein [Synechococcus sp. UW140]
MEGWLRHPQLKDNALRFHRDQKSWNEDAMVLVDHGRQMPHGDPAVLKTRQSLRPSDALILYKHLMTMGWSESEPVW